MYELISLLYLCFQHFIEKTIKISQKPNHPKGFGFTIKGGKEHGSAISVGKVILGMSPYNLPFLHTPLLSVNVSVIPVVIQLGSFAFH